MKKLFISFCLFTGIVLYAQTERCYTDKILRSLISTDNDAKLNLEQLENSLQNNIQRKLNNTPQINIPVVISILHNNQPVGTGSNITDGQVQDQLTALNDYFVSYGIKFCLATKAGGNDIPSNGGIQNTPGIIHYNTTYTNHTSNTNGQLQLANLIHPNISKSKYLRIWVVNSINGTSSGILGYSMFPNVSTVFDGIVMRYDAFGNGNSNLYPNYNLGKTLVHEVGHYLGLYHTFEAGCSGDTSSNCSSAGDRVCDTPPVANPNFNCITNTNSCIEPVNDLTDLIHNYMDYGDDNCSNAFTIGQKNRMFNIISLARSELISDENLIYTGVPCANPAILSAKFTPSTYYSCLSGNSITFTPIMNSGALTYSWDFGDSASGSNTSNLITPTHTFSSATNSPYIVTLNVSNGTNTATYFTKIFITNCSSISNSESTWYFGGSNSISFATGIPIITNKVFPNPSTFSESCALQSNSSGGVLFYTNGTYVWRDNSNVSITSPLQGNNSSKSGVLILPNPANSSQYYIFTIDAFYQNQHSPNIGLNGFRYSLVNIVNGSASMSSTVNVPITIPTGFTTGNNGAVLGGEGIAAMERCGGGYWIFTTLRKGTANYIVVYSLTTSGLSIVNSSFQLTSTNTGYDWASSIKISPDGNKIIYMNYKVNSYLLDFNKFTGVISNPISLPKCYGAAFSPDSKLLYMDSGPNANELPTTVYLYQYNMNSNNIVNSRVIVSTLFGSMSDIQQGPDNKLYQSLRDAKRLGVIHNPNTLASQSDPNTCNYTSDGIITNNDVTNSLPNLINAKLNTAFPATASISSYPLSCLIYKFVPNTCGTTFNWNFGDPTSGVNNTSTATTPTHVFSSDGTYIITLRNSSNVVIATTSITIGFTAPIIAGSSTICNLASGGTRVSNNSIVLLPGQTAIWSISSGTGTISGLNNQSDVTIVWSSAGGTISVTVTNASGCTRTVVKTINETSSNCSSNNCSNDLTFTATETSALATYQASNTIITNTNYLVNAGSTITLTAGNSITFGPSSEVKANSSSNFTARISGCIVTSPRISEEEILIDNTLKNEEEITLFPNPTNESITILTKNNALKKITIYSIEGKIVFNENIGKTNSYLININSYKNGIYIAMIETVEGNIFKEKIVKK